MSNTFMIITPALYLICCQLVLHIAITYLKTYTAAKPAPIENHLLLLNLRTINIQYNMMMSKWKAD